MIIISTRQLVAFETMFGDWETIDRIVGFWL
jgi:hypothetical protein